MGGSASRVTMKANQPSPSDPLQRSVLSEPLDDLKFTDEAFFRHLGLLKRQPLSLPSWAKLLGVHVAKHQETELEDGSFLVTDTIGGYYGGEVDVNFKHTFDPDTMTWTQTTDRDPNMQKVPVTLCYRLHSEPHRLVEAWCVNDAARNGSVQVAEAVYSLLELMISDLGIPKEQIEEKLDVKEDQPSLDESGMLVAQTGPLDDFLSPEVFWKELERLVRAGKSSGNIVDIQVQDLPTGGFQAAETTKVEDVQKVSYAVYKHDKSMDEWRSSYFQDESRTVKLHDFVTRIYRNPFRVESYIEAHAQRHAGDDVVKTVQEHVEHVIQQALQESADE